MLEQEREFYRTKREEWQASHLGQFALVKGDQLVGFFGTNEEAIVEGARRFGLQSFLVRQVDGCDEQEVLIPALALGLLRANHSCSNFGAGH